MRQRRPSETEAIGQDTIRGSGQHCPSVGVKIQPEVDVRKRAADERVMGTNPLSDTTVLKSASASSASTGPKDGSSQLYQWFYFLYITFVFMVLALGIAHNGGNRKFIPVDANNLSNLVSSQTSEVISEVVGGDMSEIGSCVKAYVDVHSSSIEEELAAICCTDSDHDGTLESKERQYQSNLCHPRLPIIGIPTLRLPFARRLTRMTEAWVLPLLPIIIRLMYQLFMIVRSFCARKSRAGSRGEANIQRDATSFSNTSSSSSLSSNTSMSLHKAENVSPTESTSPHTSEHHLIRTTLKRLLFYFLLLNFRGWGLYIGANALEDYVILPWITGNAVVSPLRTNSLSDVEHDLQYNNDEPECWYKDVLKSHHKSAMEKDRHSECYGQPFDFSDHVVLFCAHYLPIFVMEMMVYYSFPFWDQSGTKNAHSTQASRLVSLFWSAVHAFLFLYLHTIVLHALYQTAAYFHTSAEILVGYGVSLILQLPMAYLMCYVELRHVRKYLGLPSEGEMRSDKGD